MSIHPHKPNQLMIKVCFPEEIGPVKPHDLDNFLRYVQKADSLQHFQCTVGGRVLDDTAAQSDQTDSVLAQPPNKPNIKLMVDSLSYYCKTALPYDVNQGRDKLKPTVIVELFFANEPVDKDIVIQDVCEQLKDAIPNCKNGSVQINTVSFLLYEQHPRPKTVDTNHQ